MKPSVAIIRGKYLNQFEMQSYELLTDDYSIIGFASQNPLHDSFHFPIKQLLSPLDIVDPLQRVGISCRVSLGILNRVFVDAHILFGLEKSLAGFDVAHTAETYLGFTQQALRAKQRGLVKKVVSTVWENIPFNHEGIHGRKQFKQRAIAEVDHFIAVTHQAKEALIAEGCDPQKITVIYPGVDIEKFSFVIPGLTGNPRVQELDSRFRKNDTERVHLLFVGRLETEKGVWIILEMFQKLFSDFPQIRLRFCGTGSQESLLKKKVNEYGLTHVVEIIATDYNHMPQQYTWADVFVMASQDTKYWQEQFGMVLIEAMAARLPIVAWGSGAIPEVVGDAGLIINSKQDFHNSLKKLIEEDGLRHSFAEKGWQRCNSIFAQKIAVEKINEVYLSLLES